MTDELEQLRQQVNMLQQENAHLRSAMTHYQHHDTAPTIDYQALYQQLPFSIIVYQLDGLMLDGNNATGQIFGVSHEDVAGKYNVLQNPENVELGVPAYFERAVQGEVVQVPPVSFTGKYIEGRQDTEGLWLEVTFIPIRSVSGAVTYVAAIERDVTERKRHETEIATLQQEIIETQQAAIRELSTPLIPIAQDVLIMPLIGTIDSTRAQMVMEALLEGVAHYQAELAIVDITGVSMGDTQVAQALVQAAQAIQLLGAQVMLTGIQPQIAQTLIHLGVDLSGIITYGRLQSGIASVLKSKRFDEQ